MRWLTSAVVCLTLALTSQVEAGYSYGFFGITGNNATDTAIGESQLKVTVFSARRNRIKVRFDNVGTEASSLTDVYFDDRAGLFTGVNKIKSTTGVNFSVGATPGDLPGGNNLSPSFETSIGLSADADPPVALNGVNPGEKLVMFLDLASGKSLFDVTQALNDYSLRIGIHVQAFASGGSESFVTTTADTPPNIVPEPSGFALAGLGILGLVFRRRRRKAPSPEHESD